MAPLNVTQAKSPRVYWPLMIAESVKEFPPVGLVAFQVAAIIQEG